MNRQVGACYTLSVAIVIFFAIALRPPEDRKPKPTSPPVPKTKVEAGPKLAGKVRARS